MSELRLFSVVCEHFCWSFVDWNELRCPLSKELNLQLLELLSGTRSVCGCSGLLPVVNICKCVCVSMCSSISSEHLSSPNTENTYHYTACHKQTHHHVQKNTAAGGSSAGAVDERTSRRSLSSSEPICCSDEHPLEEKVPRPALKRRLQCLVTETRGWCISLQLITTITLSRRFCEARTSNWAAR